LGVAGAVIGGYLFSVFGAQGVSGLNLYSIVVAVVGAVVIFVLLSRGHGLRQNQCLSQTARRSLWAEGSHRVASSRSRIVARSQALSLSCSGRHLSLNDPTTHEVGSLQWPHGAIDERLSTAVERIALARAMRDLPVAYRTVFLMDEVKGYDHREIAGLLTARSTTRSVSFTSLNRE
jgi:hypothetical protein